MEKLDYIFIDLDGTILEGKLKHHNCYKDIVIMDGGIPLDIDIYWNMKRNKISRDILLHKSYYKNTYNNFLNKWLMSIESKKYLSYDILKPNAVNTLIGWRSYSKKLILITMRNNSENLYWQLDRLSIRNLFDDVIICKCSNNTQKYDFIKDFIFTRAIVIGDTEYDTVLASKCNIKCIAVTNGLREKKFLNSDFYTSEIKDIDLEDIIKKIY
ncbi:phosphoglycolate phosphatase-like HAD superfamily hydrolase [Clostridium beijerinckii]|uniref:HAD family hydrolase n=1 Tax=Clostridium beijerinckii TaxID=1520 RepID=UPI00149439C1|nr:HAD family hydrolase [Clostridium beijerinckii]NOW89444.1 phosphoglycolate phosphatase-like HAD superfamily hydrolase [Clostridium beijerinckii]